MNRPPLKARCPVAVLAALCLVLATTGADAGWGDESGTLSANNTLLWQSGVDPRADADPLTELYDLFDLEYQRGALRTGLRLQSFRPSRDQEFTPARFDETTLKFAEWNGTGLRLRVGNGFATIGRGLLFRAFELPGVIRDAQFPASKYLDSRDLEGFVLEAERGPFTALLFSGDPTRYPDNTPGADGLFLPRREGSVTGFHGSVQPHRALNLGFGWLRSEMPPSSIFAGLKEYGSADVSLRLAPLVTAMAERRLDVRFYAEYAARHWDPFDDGLDTDDAVPHALYTATELSAGRWGLSFETKDYADFALGFNDAPNLVPEMRQHLLNRLSHFLLAGGETGHQLSAMGALPGDWTLQLEAAHASNRINGERDYRLWFAGVESPALADLRGELFFAVGRDEVEGLTDHRTLGGSLERSLDAGYAVAASLEHQQAERTTFGDLHAFENTFASLSVTRAGLGTLALQGEFSNDPDEKDDPLTFDTVETDARSWLGLVAVVILDDNHEATVFAGQRRGGTACTSGTCYLVPDFEGVELRLSSRF